MTSTAGRGRVVLDERALRLVFADAKRRRAAATPRQWRMLAAQFEAHANEATAPTEWRVECRAAAAECRVFAAAATAAVAAAV